MAGSSAYPDYTSLTYRNGILPRKVLEFIHITLNASVPHPYELALRVHIDAALRAGASKKEVLEVFQLVSILGVHSMALSMPILLEEAKAAVRAIDVLDLTSEQEALKRAFSNSRGYWPSSWGWNRQTGTGLYAPHPETPMEWVLRTGQDACDQQVISERPDGSRVMVLVNIAPLVDAEGTQIVAVNCFQDLSAQKRSEKERDRLREERHQA
jgi:alkylhydroperoxidase/carboxymuconolactone decarboxylase family protein YurZ